MQLLCISKNSAISAHSKWTGTPQLSFVIHMKLLEWIGPKAKFRFKGYKSVQLFFGVVSVLKSEICHCVQSNTITLAAPEMD